MPEGRLPAGGDELAAVRFAASVASAVEARRFAVQHLAEVGASQLEGDVELMVSEVVTNAVVHGHAPIELRVDADASGCRIEVYDSNPILPSPRYYADTAVTGRGLHIVEELADRWGAFPDGIGKTVWFEIGDPRPCLSGAENAPIRVAAEPTATITLCECPLLLHLAWQEHAQALLRGYALAHADRDPGTLTLHAKAGAAMTLLFEQIPGPPGIDMTAPLTGALDPGMTADQVHLQLTGTAFDDFAVLQRLLRAVNDAARTDVIYGPAQPELVEFGEWVCGQVERQHAGAPPQPWTRQTPLDAPMTDHQELTQADRRHWDDRRDHVIVTDDASVILRVTAPVLEALGYARESDLLGRRIVAVVPERFHQAHVAGTALHATNGRSHLLGRPVVVPLVRASGEEVHARLCVEPTLLPNGRRVFVADVRTRDADARARASHGSGPVLLDS